MLDKRVGRVSGRAGAEAVIDEHLLELRQVVTGQFGGAQAHQVVVIAVDPVDREVRRTRPDFLAVDDHELVVHQALAPVAQQGNSGGDHLLDFALVHIVAFDHHAHTDPPAVRVDQRVPDAPQVELLGSDLYAGARRADGGRQLAVGPAAQRLAGGRFRLGEIEGDPIRCGLPASCGRGDWGCACGHGAAHLAGQAGKGDDQEEENEQFV